jgi:hypothetical protein
MAGPSPNTLSISQIKSNLLNLAQTSVYQVMLTPAPGLGSFAEFRGITGQDISEIELLCSDTNLPGSSLATHDVTNDYPGVTEKFAYRRIYDETIDFTFYVDKDYKVVEYIDTWMNYVTGQGTTFSNDQYVDRTKYYRMNYPNLYKTDNLYITKFEKDNMSSMTYQFIGAFPVNIVSMPVSYEASSILKCTASFSYIRYIRTRNRVSFASSPQNPNSPANPDIPGPVNTAPKKNQTTNQSSSIDEIVDYSVFQPSRVEAGLPYVGRNIGPIAPF